MLVYIDFTRPTHWKPFSTVIRLVQRTPYSHVRLRWTSKSGEPLIYEASGSEVRLIGALAAPKHPVEIIYSFPIKVSQEEYSKMIRLFRYAGVKYGIWQAIGMGLANLVGSRKNPWGSGKKTQVCSKLAGLFLSEIKGWCIERDFDMTGPKEIEKALRRLAIEFPDHFEGVIYENG